MEAFAYASPRVGNEGFTQHIADANYSVIRYTNNNDIFTHLASRSFGYVHVAAEIYEREVLSGKTELFYCDQNYDEDPNYGQSQLGPYSEAPYPLVFDKPLGLLFC